MFVALPSRQKPSLRWATPALFVVLWLAFVWATTRTDAHQRALLLGWGALAGGLASPEAWLAALQDGRVLRLVTALFLHADWAHLLGNLVFLLIFGLPAERAMGPWRFLLLFLLGGAVANLAAALEPRRPGPGDHRRQRRGVGADRRLSRAVPAGQAGRGAAARAVPASSCARRRRC